MAKSETEETATYAQMGMAALLPGMVHLLGVVQREIETMRQQLSTLQGQQPPTTKPRSTKRANAARQGWSDDPEERRAEMRRRMKKGRDNKAKRSHPRDPNHPGHAKWKETVQKARKDAWGRLTVRQQKAQLAAMAAGKKKPVVKLENAA